MFRSGRVVRRHAGRDHRWSRPRPGRRRPQGAIRYPTDGVDAVTGGHLQQVVHAGPVQVRLVAVPPARPGPGRAGSFHLCAQLSITTVTASARLSMLRWCLQFRRCEGSGPGGSGPAPTGGRIEPRGRCSRLTCAATPDQLRCAVTPSMLGLAAEGPTLVVASHPARRCVRGAHHPAVVWLRRIACPTNALAATRLAADARPAAPAAAPSRSRTPGSGLLPGTYRIPAATRSAAADARRSSSTRPADVLALFTSQRRSSEWLQRRATRTVARWERRRVRARAVARAGGGGRTMAPVAGPPVARISRGCLRWAVR